MKLFFFSLLAFTLSCSGLPEESKKSDKSDAKDSHVDKDLSNEEPNEEVEEVSYALGIPDFCAKNADTPDKTCFTCTPREIPMIQCSPKELSFDIAKDCSFSSKDFKCGEFNFKFGDKNKIEKLYEKLPFLLLTAQLIIGEKLKDQEEIKNTLNGTIDLFIKHKLDIFSGKNTESVIDDSMALIKLSKPDISAEELDQTKQKTLEIWKQFEAKRVTGELNGQDSLAMILTFVSSMPSASKFLGPGLKLENILGFLKSGDISGLLAGLDGLSDAADDKKDDSGDDKDDDDDKDDEQADEPE